MFTDGSTSPVGALPLDVFGFPRSTIGSGISPSSLETMITWRAVARKKVARRMYEVILPSNLGAGEYGFLPPGAFNSANSASSLGKLFSFRILE